MRAPHLLLCLALAACASAAPTAPQGVPSEIGAPADHARPVDVPAGRYRLDPRHASVTWRILHQGLSWYTARFSRFDATLDFNAGDPALSALEASIEAASVDTGLVNANGENAFDRDIAEALGAPAHPDIRFRAVRVERTGPATGRVIGDLTLNGVTRPATLEVRYNDGRFDVLRGHTVLGFSAHARIDRTEWGVERWGGFLSDEVEIVIEAEFVRS